jgi:hypothetical protein
VMIPSQEGKKVMFCCRDSGEGIGFGGFASGVTY